VRRSTLSNSSERARLKLFLDANVLVSGVLFDGPERRLLAAAESRSYEAVTSADVLAEVERAIVTKLRRPPELLAGVLDGVGLEVCVAASDEAVRKAARSLRDPKDAAVLAAAWAAGADALVTGDKDFLEAEHDLRLRVLRTSEALDLLREGRR
jgi:putative PIN family toxin of toxin-antitoxin system